jgi:hypothetical protein
MKLGLGNRTTVDRGRSAVLKKDYRCGSEVLIHLGSFSSIVEGSNDLDISCVRWRPAYMISIIRCDSDKSLQLPDALLCQLPSSDLEKVLTLIKSKISCAEAVVGKPEIYHMSF